MRWTLQRRRGYPLVETLREPSDDVLKSFLVDFRPFVSQREPVYLYRIYRICERSLGNAQLRHWLRKSREYWKEVHASSGLRLQVDNRIYRPEEIADFWINGWYFHDDPQKLDELKRLGSAGFRLHRVEFHHFLDNCVEQVLYTGNVVKAGLAEGMFDLQRE